MRELKKSSVKLYYDGKTAVICGYWLGQRTSACPVDTRRDLREFIKADAEQVDFWVKGIIGTVWAIVDDKYSLVATTSGKVEVIDAGAWDELLEKFKIQKEREIR